MPAGRLSRKLRDQIFNHNPETESMNWEFVNSPSPTLMTYKNQNISRLKGVDVGIKKWKI